MELIKINIKALSVNEAYRGKKWRTPKHDVYKTALKHLLPDWLKLPASPFCVHLEFGHSNLNSDIDNCAKLFIDSLQDKYNFNDRYIKRLIIDVEKVDKGKEYVKFNIESLVK